MTGTLCVHEWQSAKRPDRICECAGDIAAHSGRQNHQPTLAQAAHEQMLFFYPAGDTGSSDKQPACRQAEGDTVRDADTPAWQHNSSSCGRKADEMLAWTTLQQDMQARLAGSKAVLSDMQTPCKTVLTMRWSSALPVVSCGIRRAGDTSGDRQLCQKAHRDYKWTMRCAWVRGPEYVLRAMLSTLDPGLAARILL